jgi:hypothetical protein
LTALFVELRELGRRAASPPARNRERTKPISCSRANICDELIAACPAHHPSSNNQA